MAVRAFEDAKYVLFYILRQFYLLCTPSKCTSSLDEGDGGGGIYVKQFGWN